MPDVQASFSTSMNQLKATNQDCDKLALADELAQIRSAGHLASAETLNSFFITYKAALKLNGYRFTGTGAAEVEQP